MHRGAIKRKLQHCANPVLDSLRIRGMHLGPINENESKRPCGKNPAEGAAHADETELLLRVLHVGKGDGICDRDGRDIEKTMHEHQSKKRAETGCKGETDHGRTADKMAECKKLLSGKI